jgi:hypothetical protein
MKRAARAAMIIGPLTMASVFAIAGPAFAGGSPDVCVWPGSGGVQAVAPVVCSHRPSGHPDPSG